MMQRYKNKRKQVVFPQKSQMYAEKKGQGENPRPFVSEK